MIINHHYFEKSDIISENRIQTIILGQNPQNRTIVNFWGKINSMKWFSRNTNKIFEISSLSKRKYCFKQLYMQLMSFSGYIHSFGNSKCNLELLPTGCKRVLDGELSQSPGKEFEISTKCHGDKIHNIFFFLFMFNLGLQKYSKFMLSIYFVRKSYLKIQEFQYTSPVKNKRLYKENKT